MRARHTGAALLAAMLTVTLVASLTAAALWQQWRSVEVETAERTRQQSLWVLTGALDWARLILREDARSGSVDHLAEPWAIALAEARMSTFLSADKTSAADGDDTLLQAFLSGGISDLQARMNVRNLVDDNNKLSDPDFKAFAKLFEQLGLEPAELVLLASNMRLALDTSSTAPAPNAPLMPQRTRQLGWLGLSGRSLEVLLPHITLLPVRTPLNINTASAIVLYASVPSMDMARAQQLVSARQATHFRTLGDASKLLGEGAGQLNETQHSVNSRFFEVRGRLRLDQTIVEESSVVQRDGMVVKILWRTH